MIFEFVIAACFVEGIRSYVVDLKELDRRHKVGNMFSANLHSSKTWGEFFEKQEKDKLEQPELFVPIPQTWLSRRFNKL
jgi:predicted amidophosphoribosyltransferase